MVTYFDMLLRMGLACLLGGIIGLDRERNRHAAGLRTHILVCIGATLVMLCNLLLFERFRGVVNMDPVRLGAQVISGIGFLGAGTIIKEGASIKGLTTAASLWAVACIGIAIGSGLYMAATLATSFVLITLIIFSRIEHLFYSRTDKITIRLKAQNEFKLVDDLVFKLKAMGIEINRVTFENLSEDEQLISIVGKNHRNASLNQIAEAAKNITGINGIEVCD